ncbi:MAG TPA: hypothetical protein VGW33_05680 [Terriglobia bacterium]|nr:hypothetical protein [Terriglobia bacterium]
MKTATTVVQMMIRLFGLILIVLGILFWAGRSINLVPAHIWVGTAFVLLLWILAFMSLRVRGNAGLAVGAIVWGLVVMALGMTQVRLLTGSAHWVVQVLHLLVGLGAIGLAESLAARVKRA